MNIKNALAGIAVHDIESSIAWYEALIGRPPDIRPLGHVAAWQFPGGGWIEVFQDDTRAGKSLVIFAVDSLEVQVLLLQEKRISSEHLIPSPDIGEVVLIDDPDGNQIVFAGPLTGVLDD